MVIKITTILIWTDYNTNKSSNNQIESQNNII
jgi:hypothetical protein